MGPHPADAPQLRVLLRRHPFAIAALALACTLFATFWLTLPDIVGLARYRPPLPSVLLPQVGSGPPAEPAPRPAATPQDSPAP